MPALKKLVLASASPRRRELLEQIGVPHDCDPANIDETVEPGESPTDYVERMARCKAECVAARHPLAQYSVLAADTTVVLDGDVLGKPEDFFDGLSMLARLSGRTHTVMTAVCLHHADGVVTLRVDTEVQFALLERAVCEAYLASDEPWDKAGAYGIQGLGGAFVSAVHGSYSSVVGLPLAETWQLLSVNGITTGLESGGE